jgi:hypothetical protein
MAGYVTYNGISCECGECGARVSEGNAQMKIRWSNQHGSSIRIFCDLCGVWTDWVRTNKRASHRTFRPVIPHPTYVDRVLESEATDAQE